MSTTGDAAHNPFSYTFVFKQVNHAKISLDLYPPYLHSGSTAEMDEETPESAPRVPALVYFHGGGMTVGNRASWQPAWLRGKPKILLYGTLSSGPLHASGSVLRADH